VAYRRLEERRAVFQKQIKEQSISTPFYFRFMLIESRLNILQANKMREIIGALTTDVDTLIAKLEREFEDMGKDNGSAARTRKRERTVEGILAELQL
jgi:hypothetical protein